MVDEKARGILGLKISGQCESEATKEAWFVVVSGLQVVIELHLGLGMGKCSLASEK